MVQKQSEKELRQEANRWMESLGFTLDTEGGVAAWDKPGMGYIPPEEAEFFYKQQRQAIDQAVAEARVEKTVTVTEADFVGEYDLYESWYTCPNCRRSPITYHSVFCPYCGRKIDWQFHKQEKSA